MEISDPSKRSCDIPSCPSLDRKVSPQLAKLDQVWSHFPVLSLLFMFSDMYCNINNMYVCIYNIYFLVYAAVGNKYLCSIGQSLFHTYNF